MNIKYYQVDNPFTDDPHDRRAQITSYESAEENDLFEYICRSGSGITPAQAKAHYDEIIDAHEYFLKKGYGINTRFLKVRPTIQGVFKNTDDRFDAARHRIIHKARLGNAYSGIGKEIKAEKVEPVSNAPLPASFEDVATETINELLTPGGVATLSGMRLKFDRDDPQQGIFLISRNSEEFRVEKIVTMKPKQVVFMLPTGLEQGDYTLEVRILPKGNKAVRKGALPDKITV